MMYPKLTPQHRSMALGTPFASATEIHAERSQEVEIRSDNDFNYYRRVEPDRGGEFYKLNYVDSTLAALDSRYK